MTVSSMECVMQISDLTWSTWAPLDASGTSIWRIALPKFARGSMRVQDYDSLFGELSRSVALQGDSYHSI
jgi:hypothetical protein